MSSPLARLLGIHDATDEADDGSPDDSAHLVDGRDAVPERDRY